MTSRRDGLHLDDTLRAQLEDVRGEPSSRGDEEFFARIAWSRLVEPGDGTAGVLLSTLGEAESLRLLIADVNAKELRARVVEAGGEITADALTAGLQRWRPRLSRSETLGDIERAQSLGIRIITPADSAWPGELLLGLGHHTPTVLWARGDASLLRAPSLSVVGARAASGYGTHITAEIVGGVGQVPWSGVTVS